MRRTVAKGFSALVVSCVVVGTSFASESVPTALQVGEPVNEFIVEDITGAAKGGTICYRCRYGPAPVVCVFARKTSPALTSLVTKLEQKLVEVGRFRSFVVILPGAGVKPLDALRKMARDANLKNIPLTIAKNVDGPPDYKIAPEADVEVVMWNVGKVRVNLAYKGGLTDADIQSILAEIPKVLTN